MENKEQIEQIMYGIILVTLLCFLGVQIYEGFQTNIIIGGNIVSDGKYYYVDLSKMSLDCEWDEENQKAVNCVDNSEDKICKYNLDGTFAGDCWDKNGK